MLRFSFWSDITMRSWLMLWWISFSNTPSHIVVLSSFRCSCQVPRLNAAWWWLDCLHIGMVICRHQCIQSLAVEQASRQVQKFLESCSILLLIDSTYMQPSQARPISHANWSNAIDPIEAYQQFLEHWHSNPVQPFNWLDFVQENIQRSQLKEVDVFDVPEDHWILVSGKEKFPNIPFLHGCKYLG